MGRMPFSIPAVERADPTGLCGNGVLTIPALSELLRVTLLERNYTPQKGLEAILELLENYDLLIKGTKLKFSANDGSRGSLHTPKSAGGDSGRLYQLQEQSIATSPSYPSNHSVQQLANANNTLFYLMPSCFTGVAPAILTIHLPRLLMGPSYRFSLNMIPTSFFARFVARVAKYATKMYLGPVLSSASNNSGITSSTNELETFNGHGMPAVDNAHKFWSDAVWILSGSMSRAYVRMVSHSLFVTFHDRAQDEEFHDGLRQVITSLVAESPGAQCEEAILCRPTDADPTDDSIDFGELIWRPTEENINSLEKIRERESAALKSARGARTDIVAKLRRAAERGTAVTASDVDEEEGDMDLPVPYVRPLRGSSIDDAEVLRLVTAEASLLDDVVVKVEKALKLIQRGQAIANECHAVSARGSECDSETSSTANAEAERGYMLEGRGMDALVDALAQD